MHLKFVEVMLLIVNMQDFTKQVPVAEVAFHLPYFLLKFKFFVDPPFSAGGREQFITMCAYVGLTRKSNRRLEEHGSQSAENSCYCVAFDFTTIKSLVILKDWIDAWKVKAWVAAGRSRSVHPLLEG